MFATSCGVKEVDGLFIVAVHNMVIMIRKTLIILTSLGMELFLNGDRPVFSHGQLC